MIDFSVVVLKGVIDHRDAGVYFGSTMNLGNYANEAIRRGWLRRCRLRKYGTLVNGYKATKEGRAEYRRRNLGTLPTAGRAYMWDDRSGLLKDDRMDEPKCWIVQYHHRFGTDAWPIFSAKKPTQKQVVKTLEDWEGDKREDEWIEILGPWSLDGRRVA